MLIHPWDAARDDAEWQEWLGTHDFGQLAVNGPSAEPPFVQPLHFLYDGERGEVLAHLARPNPVWPALEADPDVLLSVVDDYVYAPGYWQATPDEPTEHGTPTSYYAAVQLRCRARVVDDPAEKAELLTELMGHFQPEGGTAEVAAGEGPFGRMLSGLRGVRLEVVGIRAKFKYAGRKPEAHGRIAAGLAERGGPRDAAALRHLSRRRGA